MVQGSQSFLHVVSGAGTGVMGVCRFFSSGRQQCPDCQQVFFWVNYQFSTRQSLIIIRSPCASPAPPGGSIAHVIPLNYPKSRYSSYSIIATGASKAAGRSPWSVRVFRSLADSLFCIPCWTCNFCQFSLRKSVSDSGVKIA